MLVDIERRGHVAIVYLNDEKRKNALSTVLVTDAMAAISESCKGPDPARALVLANHGTDFCAGADIRDMLDTGWLESEPRSHGETPTPVDLFKLIDADPRPVVAAVRGLVLGGGVELATVCDLVLAAPQTTFRLPEIGLGVLPNTALARLPAIIGRRRTAELILSRRAWSAEEAERFGFVTAIAPEEELLERAVALAAAIVKGAPPAAIGGVKSALRTADWDSIDGILGLMNGAEWREGTSAFVQKRKPDYEDFWSKE
ncbi:MULTISPECIES: enoyl-CoA hydratase/isomerase family protein [Chelativorans]|uniref:Enoyl-CoA hydratase/isomerase n=1 Tax=Chelativorans sp. (strain BNC1) TaxID=266779 RepID=Q11AS3_CHESB|nr:MULTISPECIES: enoyl-CoA hydratase/isomerase family protein [Chelativorans]